MKTVVAFLIGAAVTGLVFFLLLETGQRDNSDFADLTSETLVPTTTPELPVSKTESNAPETASNAPEGTLPEQFSETTTSPLPPESDASLEPAPLLPISLPAEFAWLSTTPGFLDFQRQDIDPNWSSQTERQIGDYLIGNAEIVSEYGVPTVHCRTTSCKVLIASYGSSEDTLSEELRQLLAKDYASQPWSTQFIGSIQTYEQDGVETLVWTLARRSSQATPP